MVSNNISFEIIHFINDEFKILSRGNKVFLKSNEKTILLFVFPFVFFDIFIYWRLARRLFRLDKCNIFVVSNEPLRLVCIRQGKVYYFDERGQLYRTLVLRNCRNILHVELCIDGFNNLYFGEYGANNERRSVPIYRSKDGGQSWQVVYEFPKNSIKHIHNVKRDPFTGKIWTLTGDKDGECFIMISNENFSEIEIIGDGSQLYRSCNLFFTKEEVVWLMDSPNEESFAVHFNRESQVATRIFPFRGPVWYSTELENGTYIAATSVEPGYSMQHETAEILISNDLVNWKSIVKFKKDRWPIDFFKYGVISFPIGAQNIFNFYCFGEALEGFDGAIRKFDFSEEI